MSEPLSLFGEDPEPATARERRDPVVEWQLDHIRRGLDARGISDMGDRQAFVVKFAGRHVASLRELTYTEAQAVLDELGPPPAITTESKPSSSAWDDREEDTWIDRL